MPLSLSPVAHCLERLVITSHAKIVVVSPELRAQLLVLPFNRSMPLFSAEVPDTTHREAEPFRRGLPWTTHFPLRDLPQ